MLLALGGQRRQPLEDVAAALALARKQGTSSREAVVVPELALHFLGDER